jgi:hypothetical protein
MPAVIRVAVPISQIKREVLLESNIRIFNGGEPLELGFSERDCKPSNTKTPCWIVSKSALSIFSDLKYTPRTYADSQIDLDNIGYWPCCLQYRDGSVAVANKDPSTVYVITDVSGDHQSIVSQVRPYLDTIKRDVEIHYANGYRCQANTDEDRLEITVFGGLESENYQDTYRSHVSDKRGEKGPALFGHPNGLDNIAPSNNAYNDLNAVHVLSPEGVIVAYVYSNDITIPFAAKSSASKEFREDVYSKVIQLSLEAWNKRFNTLPTPEETKALFSEFLSERKNLLVNEYNVQIKAKTDHINNLTASLTEAINTRNTLLMDLASRSDAASKLETEYTNEYGRLSKNAKLKSFKITDDQLVAYTKTIYFTGPDEKEREVGEMRISLGLSTGSISFHNMTRKVTGMQVGMHAPHVFPSGNPCLGNMSSVIPKLVTSYMLADAVDMSIAYLEAVNERDAAGKHYKKWPLSDEQKKKDKAAKKAEREAAKAAAESADQPAEEVNV